MSESTARRTKDEWFSLIQECRKSGMTVVVITHNSALTAMADRIIRVKSGKILEEKLNPNRVDIDEIEW